MSFMTCSVRYLIALFGQTRGVPYRHAFCKERSLQRTR
jgi:hypothetical protein